MYVRCDESSLYSRINYVHSLTGNFSAGVSRNNLKRCWEQRVHVALCILPCADTEETGRYDLAWKDLCSVLNALSK